MEKMSILTFFQGQMFLIDEKRWILGNNLLLQKIFYQMSENNKQIAFMKRCLQTATRASWTILFLQDRVLNNIVLVSCLEQYCFRILSWTILFQDRVLNNIVPGSCLEQYCFRIVSWTILFQDRVLNNIASGSCLEQYCFRIMSWTILFQDRVLNNIVFRIVSWTILFHLYTK